jgi:biotin transport system substrate-specific component
LFSVFINRFLVFHELFNLESQGNRDLSLEPILEVVIMTPIVVSIAKVKNNQALSVLLASCLIGVFAQIKIPLPFTIVPLTGQTIGVMLAGAMLGRKMGAAAAFAYLIQGALGFPVWAGGRSGLLHFFGPTGGYLLAYPLEAYLIGWCLEGQIRTVKTIGALFIPWIVQMVIGTLWLAFFVGIDRAFFQGFYPFIGSEISKSAFIILLTRWKS